MERKPTIALLLPQALDPIRGGVQRSTWQLGHYLAGRGWNVIFISLSEQGHWKPKAGVLKHPLPGALKEGKELRAFIEDAIRSTEPDIVLNQVGVAAEPAATVWRLRRSGARFGVISCFRNNPSLYRDNHRHIVRHQLRKHRWAFSLLDHALGWWVLMAVHRRKNRRVFRRALDRCDRLMLLSPTFVDELRWYLPDLDETKVVAIPNGFRLPGPPSEGSKHNRLLYVGRMDHAQKNVLMIPQVWSTLQEQLPGWEFHIVGAGPDLRQLEDELSALRVLRCHIHGHRTPEADYRSSKIFLMLSAYEGFGNTLVEAQMHGVVPIAFRRYSAIDWMLNDGVDAIRVPPFDMDRYVEEVVNLSKDESRWERMSVAARENAKRFSEDRVGRIWEGVLWDVLRERGSPVPIVHDCVWM